jgi:hypothetical protein
MAYVLGEMYPDIFQKTINESHQYKFFPNEILHLVALNTGFPLLVHFLFYVRLLSMS